MNSKLLETIGIERRRYVEYFIEKTTSLKEGKANFAIELPIKTNELNQTEPFNLIRLDFIFKDEKNEDSISELRLDTNSEYDSFEFYVHNSRIVLNPFCWNSCEIIIDKLEIVSLKQWVFKWIKINDFLNDEKLSDAIHSCSVPITIEGKYSFIVDFGTAPISALTDLLEILCDAGAKEIDIATLEV